MSKTTKTGPIGPMQPPSALTPAESRSRLAQHMQVLQAFGHTDLSALGKLTLGLKGKPEVAILQRSGVLIPSQGALFQAQPEPMTGIAMRSLTKGAFENLTGNIWVTASKPLPSGVVLAAPASSAGLQPGGVVATPSGPVRNQKAQQVIYPFAYWFATEIDLQDDTTVVLAEGVKSLVIIAEKLTIGKRVTISWERPKGNTASDVPPKPPLPSSWPKATKPGSERGRVGFNGVDGNKGDNGEYAPELELWFLEATGYPAIDLRGQDGFIGIRGGDGGDGGTGQDGCDTERKGLNCIHTYHSGGDGGNGGAPGNGGPGGIGGDGGRFVFFAPQSLINTWMNAGMTISVDGGNGGSGGDPGRPGEGGSGGPRGAHSHNLCPKNLSAGTGAKGNAGPSGKRGPDGIRGNLLPGSIKASPITPSDFYIEATKPAILSLEPKSAFVGDTITVVGKRFATGDQVFIRGFDGQINVGCATTLVSTSPEEGVLSFVVPNVPGGLALFQVKQTDGTLSSSKGTLLVRPRISAIFPTGRIRPGKDYFIQGSGLGLTGRVWIDGKDIGPFTVVDNTTIKFKATNPPIAEVNEAGKNAKLKVVNAEGIGQANLNHSAEVNIVLDTYHMVVFGDSVVWGGGLPEHQKFYSLAADYLSAKLGNAKVHKTIKAHHGAPIGRNNTVVKPEMPGELSSRWPTILQQVDTMATLPDAPHVDLVIIGGGANDLPITDVMLISDAQNLQNEISSLVARTKQFCKDDMVFMLQKVLQKFPNAKVIVTGYYHIFSEQSNTTFIQGYALSLIENISNFPGITSNPSQTRAKIIALSNVWVEESNKNLAAAVDQVNADPNTEPRAFFVNPATQPSNAAHAPNSFLWEPTSLGAPTDPMWKGGREQQRDAHETRLKSESGTLGNGWHMAKSNSSYHPNPAGAQNYFQKMKPALDAEVKVRTVALRCSSGRYVTRTSAGGSTLAGSSLSIGALETFDLIDLGNNQVALRTMGVYVSAVNGVVTANKSRIGATETFTLVAQPAQKAAFKTASGKYLTASGNAALTANASTVSQTEAFVVV